jgi:hypothetical protein
VLDSLTTVREMGGTDPRLQMPEGIETLWTSFLEHYNLLSTISTFPVGVPTMMAGQGPLNTPLGPAQIIEVNSPLSVMGVWLVATLVGLILGSLYFASVQHYSVLKSGVEKEGAEIDNAVLSLSVLGRQVLQVVLLMMILFIILMIMFLPTIFVTSILTLLSPALATIALLAMSFMGLWLMIPLVFSPHGIFVLRQNALSAILTSARLVRFFLPGTGLFLLITVIFYQGLGALWRTPPDTSWMALVGILGHAFISTALLSASFIYYRSGHEFVLSLRKSMNSA